MRRSWWCLVIVLVFLSGTSRAEESCAETQSRWGWGSSWSVGVTNGTLLYSSGTVLIAVSSADDVEQGHLDVGGVIQEIFIFGDRAYLAAGPRGLVIVDISEPSHMRILSSTEDPSNANGVASNGTLAVVTGSWHDVSVFDISSPENPVRLSMFDMVGLVEDAVFIGHFVAIAEGDTGIAILDLSDPAHPVEAALVPTGGYALRIIVNGSTLFVGDTHKGMLTIDVGDPANPTILATLPLSGVAMGIAVAGSTAWVAGDYTGIFAVDVSDPAAPVVMGTGDTSLGVPVDVAADGTSVWFTTYSRGAARFDGSDPGNPQEITRYSGAGKSRSVEALGTYAVVADWEGITLRVFDIGERGEPSLLGDLELPGNPLRMEIASHRAFIAMEYGGLAVVDLGDPENPTLLSTLPDVNGRPQDIALLDDVALVVTMTAGLKVIDISNPEAPSILASLELPDPGAGISLSGTTAYVAAHQAGLVIIDVSTPSEPRILSTLDINAVAVDTTTMGDRVLVSGYYSGLFIVDVSNPAAPTVISDLGMPNMARSTVVGGHLGFVSNGGQGLSVVDLEDPANPVLLGTTAMADESWYGAFVGDRFVLADNEAGFTVFDVTSCGDTAPPLKADFEYSPDSPRAGETVTFTDLSSGNPTVWSWSFGDDGSTSSDQNPSHIFSVPGAFDVHLEVSDTEGSSATVRSILIRPAEGELPPVDYPFTAISVIPAAAHVAGAENTAWVTDVVLHNPDVESVVCDLFFLKTRTNGTTAEAVEIVVPAGQSVLLADIVFETFGRARASGAVLVGSEKSLIVSSRTYNNVEGGTYGQFIPGIDIDEALEGGENATVIQLMENASFRTNLGVANIGDLRLEMTAELRSSSGNVLGTRDFEVPPWSHIQLNSVFTSVGVPNLADGYAVISAATDGARWFAYASVVDNRSGDPVYAAPVVRSSEVLWIPAAAHVHGANSTNWRTDIEVFTEGNGGSPLDVQWLKPEGGTPVDADLTVSTDPCLRVEDVLSTLFQGEGAGGLRIDGGGRALAVTSRTFNDPGNQTYGQYIPAVAESEILHWGQAVRLVQLAYSSDTETGFRTNIGLINMTGDAVTIVIDLFKGDETYLGRHTDTLGPWQYTQINNIFDGMTTESLDNAFAIVATLTGDASFFTYASVVDNGTGDPVFIPAVLEP